ncbi:hypothetical protein [Niveibacterium terrae]|uniref:hypothetical protein n=1 Tax=Niveibacterium terrae TaxID=3373598 RepID=UPI003A935776
MVRIDIRRLALSCLLSVAICTEAFAEEPLKSCSNLTIYQYLDSLDQYAFQASVSTDIRGRAGFRPAIVVELTVPSRPVIADFSGEANIAAESYQASLRPTRAEYWLMGQFPRSANPAPAVPEFKSRDTKGGTMYFLFFKEPEEAPQEFRLTLGTISYDGRKAAIPELRFQRSASGPGIVLCGNSR